MRDIIGLILGGGKGTRLGPLTEVRSKPAVPLAGKYRLIDIPISNCLNSDINRIFVLTQFNSVSLNRHVSQTYRFGLFSRGFVDILAAQQTPTSSEWFQGTADAVRQSLRFVLPYEPRHVLVLSADHLYRMDYRPLIAMHQERNADVTLCALPVSSEKASDLGILQLDNDSRIQAFHEKPTDADLVESLKLSPTMRERWQVQAERPLLASMGIYVFRPDVLEHLLDDDTQLDFGRDIIPRSLDRHRVFGYVFNGYWEDIGTVEAFYRAHLSLLDDKPAFNLHDPDFPFFTHARFLPPTLIRETRVKQSLISEGCVIQSAEIVRSIVGIRSIVGAGARIVNSLVMGADFYESEANSKVAMGIGPAASIENAILDKNVRIGRGVQIRNAAGRREFDAPNYCIRDGIVIIPKGAEIPDGVVI
ncbi:MAG: glucose-1-phosphate adenylyltransferase [Acidobacteria bacterium]|nr:glucose-1-phosphate adenylyltransferase [Acidobacteriota bacterium]